MNDLAQETSPYLLQHRDNPVDWRPWGPAALAQAKEDDKPILLSVGYAACHWCHVMAHESFENPQIAALMNKYFVNIKVDREERPDVDRIYMDALHMLGEHGGWPLTMFLTPEGQPFWGGTYFPPEPRYGRPGFPQILTQIARIWREERDKVFTNSQALQQALTHRDKPGYDAGLDRTVLESAAEALLGAIDFTNGGLKGAPKFPQASLFRFFHALSIRNGNPRLLDATEVTLTHICQGGIYDHLGGGIARYSVDYRWLMPHFEKMLYDSAQHLSLLTRAWTITRSDLFAIRTAETAEFLLRDMNTGDGAFASSYDADSEGEEGKYYVWSYRELVDLLPPPDAHLFCRTYDATPAGNWEGKIILNRLTAPEFLDSESEEKLRKCRAILLARRTQRSPPGFDDKVLADWNGLAIQALAEASEVFQQLAWLVSAERAFVRVIELLWTGSALHHSWRVGQTRHYATVDGYAYLCAAALALHGATQQTKYLDWAEKLAAALVADHWNAERGAFHFASIRASELIVRPLFGHDDATPNANAVMLGNYARLHLLTGKADHRHRAQALERAFAPELRNNPFGYATLMTSFLDLSDPVQIVLTGDAARPQHKALHRLARDRLGVDAIFQIVTDGAELPTDHPAHHKESAPEPRLYVCRGQVCAMPATDEASFDAALELLQLKRAA